LAAKLLPLLGIVADEYCCRSSRVFRDEATMPLIAGVAKADANGAAAEKQHGPNAGAVDAMALLKLSPGGGGEKTKDERSAVVGALQRSLLIVRARTTAWA
jgi:hypothetical protein